MRKDFIFACRFSRADSWCQCIRLTRPGTQWTGDYTASDEEKTNSLAAPAPGDMSIGAVVKGLKHKLRNMEQEFRIVRNNYEHGPARDVQVKISPRGPRGFTGRSGIPGVTGPVGLIGSVGRKGAKGYRGPRGIQGVRGRTGQVGMVGAKGMAGKEGAEGD